MLNGGVLDKLHCTLVAEQRRGLLANANVTNATVPSGFGGNGTAASFVFGFAVRTGGARMQVLIDDLLIASVIGCKLSHGAVGAN